MREFRLYSCRGEGGLAHRASEGLGAGLDTGGCRCGEPVASGGRVLKVGLVVIRICHPVCISGDVESQPQDMPLGTTE
jgi:hypothetical protein